MISRWFTVLVVVFATATASAAPLETLPPGMQLVGLEAFPPRIELTQRFDYRQILLTARTAAGERVDVTRMATLELPAKLVEVSATGLVRPTADGQGEIVCTVAGQTAKIPVQVAGLGQPRDVSFVRDVQPVLTKLGCNQGTCHGSAKGRNGFKLSLRGYDPLFDHRALTDDSEGRRFNRAAPDQSLMLLKPTGQAPHVGGVVMQPGDPNYDLVRQWIAAGVKLDLDAVKPTKIEILPQNPIVPLPKMTQQMVVLATFSDGSVRDVTAEAFVESGNIEVIEADKRGVLTMLRRGEAPVLVRYAGNYAATTLTVMGDRSGFTWQQPPTYNYIDEHVYNKLQRVRTSASGVCTDSEFVRRLFLDLTGLPPSAEDVRKFLADPRESRVKREALVDELVGNPAFVEHWTNKWADLLQVNRKFLGEEGAVVFRQWIRAAVAANMPYDQFANTILTATGSNQANPPASYFKILRTPQDTMENTTQLFLAVRFNCNKCHDHPFERWTQGQYYHLAAYFAQVGFKADPAAGNRKIGGSAVEGAKDLFEIVYDTGAGDVKHEGTGQVAAPKFPYDHADVAPADRSRREQLARWITSRDNQYFARSYVNRLWGYLLGVGIIEPLDDIRAGNPPTNPELLDALTKEFVDSGFNAQKVLKTICKSRTYQHSIATDKWNDDDTINFSHAQARRLPAEVLFDAIHVSTGSTPRLPGVPAGFRAAQLPDAGVSLPFLDDLGRPPRESACECERSGGVLLAPVMKLINGPTVSDAIADSGNAITKLVAAQNDDAKVIEELYLRFWGRQPSAKEIERSVAAFRAPSADHQIAKAALAKYEPTLDAKQADWERHTGATEWTVLEPGEMKSSAGAKLEKRSAHAILVTGKRAKDTYTVTFDTPLTEITGIRLEALTDPRLPASGPGRAENGNFVLNEFRVTAAPKSDAAKALPVKLRNGQADFSQQNFSPAGAIDGNGDTGWAIHPAMGQNHLLVYEFENPISQTGGTRLTVALDQFYADGMHSLGRFRISVTRSPRPLRLTGPPEAVAKLLAVPAAERTAEQKAAVAAHFRSLDVEYVRLAKAVADTAQLETNKRLVAAQDLAWALLNSPMFLFNR